jgi:hypothetical protein
MLVLAGNREQRQGRDTTLMPKRHHNLIKLRAATDKKNDSTEMRISQLPVQQTYKHEHTGCRSIFAEIYASRREAPTNSSHPLLRVGSQTK